MTIRRRAAFVAVLALTLAGGKPPLPGMAADNGLAQKPLMGWSSWAPLRKGLNESIIKAQADAMASRLRASGYQYINLDAGWRDYSRWDAHGRQTWSTSKFPSGMPALAAYVHGKGLKLGIYLHPGLDLGPASPYELNTPILGTPYRARDIADTSQWGNTDKSAYRIDFSRPGAREYIQSYADLMASWGIDYIKFDFVGPGGGRAPADNREEMEHWLAALKNTGRPIWIELSNSLSFAHAAHWRTVANGWRINGDIESGTSGTITSWNNVSKRFRDAPKWFPFAGPGGWNDYDSLPLGNGTRDGLTPTERQTTMTLWSIGCSPLILGSDLRNLDSFDLGLITNPEVIAVNQAGRLARPVSQATSQQVWRLQNADGSHTVALFNLGTATATVRANWSDLGFSGSAAVRDLWTHTELGAFTDGYGASLASHGSRLLRVTPGSAPLSFESESLTYVTNGAPTSLQTDVNSSGGRWVSLDAVGAGDSIDYTLPNVPAGTYEVRMQWKGNNNRGRLGLEVDGVDVGGTLDQYAATQTYPTTSFGTVTFAAAGSHTVRLTVIGRNDASRGYKLSADRFVMVRR